jgi:hypothetical protein
VSKPYSRTLSELLRERLDRTVTQRLNAVYDEDDSSSLDPELARLQSASLERDDW